MHKDEQAGRICGIVQRSSRGSVPLFYYCAHLIRCSPATPRWPWSAVNTRVLQVKAGEINGSPIPIERTAIPLLSMGLRETMAGATAGTGELNSQVLLVPTIFEAEGASNFSGVSVSQTIPCR